MIGSDSRQTFAGQSEFSGGKGSGEIQPSEPLACQDNCLMAQRASARPRRPRAAPTPTSERKIHFFRALTPKNTAGRPSALPVSDILDHIETLPCVIGQRYLEQPDSNVLCAWMDSGLHNPRMRLATVRRSGLPMLEDGGTLSPLAIAASAGLYEPIHVCFFPENIVGVEFNFYGPRPSRLPIYMRRTAPNQCPPFSLAPLLRQNVMEQLGRMRELKVVSLKILASYSAQVAEADTDLGAAFEAARRVGESEVVQLVLQPAPYHRRTMSQRALGAVRRLAERLDLRDNALAFTVTGLDEASGHLEEIDILSDELVATKKIIRMDPRTRALDDGAAYAAIEEAFQEMEAELRAAASAQIA